MKIVCAICQKEVRANFIKQHLENEHKITTIDYYRLYCGSNQSTCYCGKATEFISIVKGFRLYCSNECKQKSPTRVEKALKTKKETGSFEAGYQKAKETVANWSVDRKLEYKENLLSGIRKNRLAQDDPRRDQFKTYKYQVYYQTYRIANSVFGENWKDKIGRMGDGEKFQIDHLVSIRDGFDNNLPVEIIAHPANLQLIPWKENSIKGSKSAMTIQELLSQANFNMTKNWDTPK